MSVLDRGKNDAIPETVHNPNSAEIFGTGEMADLTRSYDWSSTSVGPIEQWPEALVTTVNTILCSRHPMFLWWGKEHIQFYNDAYRTEHPGKINIPTPWAERKRVLARDLAHHRPADRSGHEARRGQLA